MFEVEGIPVHINNAPPVYAPGGPVAFVHQFPNGTSERTLGEIESQASEQNAVLLVVQCPVQERETEAMLLAQGYTFASSWYLGPPTTDVEDPTLVIRAATAADVRTMLEIGERKRQQYDTFSPVFWKIAPTPREEFAPYVISQVESETNIALVAESDGVMRGYLIAQCRNLNEGYVDDYATDNHDSDWATAGFALLSEAGRLAKARHVETLMIVTGHADAPKRAAIERLGYVLQKNWLVKPLVSAISL